MNGAIITAALTGPIAHKSDHPYLPCSAEEIAAAALGAYEAGAAVVHVHIRDESGEPTADVETTRRTLAAVKEACPALVQLSTGVGLEVPYEERVKLLDARPAMATLNVCSMSFGTGEFRNPPCGVRRMAARMRELGIKPELEIYDVGHLEMALRLVQEDLLEEPLHCSIVLGVRGGMAATPENLVHMVSKLPSTWAWQVIGVGRSNLTLTAIGLAIGGNARTGLEDTLTLRKGLRARDNAELVTRLVGVAEAMERPPASVAEARRRLGLGA